MARGRFISNAIITDRKVNELSSDTVRLAFTWWITLADKEGRVVADEFLMKAALFPRRSEITAEVCWKIASELAEKDFILLYQDDSGEKYGQFPNFEKHQKGLRKDREPASEIPHWDGCKHIAGRLPEDCRIVSGKMRVNNNVNENNNNNDKDDPASGVDVFSFYEQEIGPLSQTIADSLDSAVKEWDEKGNVVSGHEAVTEAIKIAKKNNVRKMSYIEGVLDKWLQHGYGWTPGKQQQPKEESSPWNREYIVIEDPELDAKITASMMGEA